MRCLFPSDDDAVGVHEDDCEAGSRDLHAATDDWVHVETPVASVVMECWRRAGCKRVHSATHFAFNEVMLAPVS